MVSEERKAQLLAEAKAKYEKNYELLHGVDHQLNNDTLFCTNEHCKQSECRYHRHNIRSHSGIRLMDISESHICKAERGRVFAEKKESTCRYH